MTSNVALTGIARDLKARADAGKPPPMFQFMRCRDDSLGVQGCERVRHLNLRVKWSMCDRCEKAPEHRRGKGPAKGVVATPVAFQEPCIKASRIFTMSAGVVRPLFSPP